MLRDFLLELYETQRTVETLFFVLSPVARF